MLFINVDAAPLVKYSPKKMEMGIENTTEMIRARKEVARVPTRKGKAPNSSLTGSHVVLPRNRTPKFLRAGKEAMANERKMAKRRTTTQTPAMKSSLRKDDSESPNFHPTILFLRTIPKETPALRSFKMDTCCLNSARTLPVASSIISRIDP
jgi:hypothetical protein